METIGRLLNIGKSSAAMNMAIDEAILLSQKERSNPTLRFYDWETPAFSFGYFQDIASEVDVEGCRADGIELVKRMTGGGTVVHGWELTYTLVLPRGVGEIGVSEAYRRIGQSLVKAFQKLGVPAQCHAAGSASSSAVTNRTYRADVNICLTNPAEHDVMSDNKKVAGVSVRRNRDGIMFQGYISLDMPPSAILKRVSKDSKVQETLREKSAAINTEGRFITRDALIQAISETFDLGIAFKSARLSLVERAQAETLAETKYATTAWNFG
jgi:lipoate-protein ligase A